MKKTIFILFISIFLILSGCTKNSTERIIKTFEEINMKFSHELGTMNYTHETLINKYTLDSEINITQLNDIKDISFLETTLNKNYEFINLVENIRKERFSLYTKYIEQYSDLEVKTYDTTGKNMIRSIKTMTQELLKLDNEYYIMINNMNNKRIGRIEYIINHNNDFHIQYGEIIFNSNSNLNEYNRIKEQMNESIKLFIEQDKEYTNKKEKILNKIKKEITNILN